MTDKVVLITGASSGIGLASARKFLEEGWTVVATMRRPHDSQLAGEQGDKLLLLPIDVTDEKSIHDSVDFAVKRLGRIDALVNNAGFGLNGPLEGWTAEQLRRQFDVNLFGLVDVTRHVLPVMRDQKDGVIVNVSSIGGRLAFPFTAAYHATKFAVEGLSESLRFELKQHGIRVKVVEPGGIKTDFITRGTQWASHPAYEPHLSPFRAMADRLNDRLPGPAKVAAVIHRAATDGSGRLRYRANAGPYPFLHAVLPDAIWRSLVGMALNRQASGSGKPATGTAQSRAG